MADQPVTIEKLINADKDFQTIEDFIKKPKDETVTTRFGDEIMTLKGLEEEVKKSGGYFKRYATLAAANADIANIPLDAVVKVTSAADGGDYEKVSAEATTLTKSAFDPVNLAKAFTLSVTGNLFLIKDSNSIEYTLGYSLNTSGGLFTATNNWRVSDYIPVSDAVDIEYKLQTFSGSLNDVAAIIGYDFEKKFVRVLVRSNSQAIETLEGRLSDFNEIRFVRLGHYTGNNIFNLKITPSLLRRPELDEKISQEALKNTPPIVEAQMTTSALNLLTSTTLTTNKIINTSGAEITANVSASWSSTDFIAVKSGDVISYEIETIKSGINPAAIVYYDGNKQFISAPIYTDAYALTVLKGEVEVPVGVAFIRASFFTGNSIYALEKKNKIYQSPVFKQAVVDALPTSQTHRYSGKKLMTIGDSITDSVTTPTTYPPIVAAHFGMTLFDGGWSGRRIRNAFGRAAASDANILVSDIITIAHGTNDFKLETSLGAIADTPTSKATLDNASYNATGNQVDGTFYADYKGVIEHILSVKPTARIMLITPIRRTQPAATNTDTNAKGHKLVDYVNAIKAIAEYYSLPILDNYNTSGINALNMSTMTTDGLHPTAWAQRNILAQKIIGFIESN